MATEDTTHAEQAAEFATANALYRYLEGTVFKAIIAYTIHPLHILALLVLWIGLLVSHSTIFELVGGNYTNGLSAMAASIVLLQQTHQHREVKRLHREHRLVLEELRHLLQHGS
ncbi:MAG: hypothetical protein C4344_05560 [Acidimicrobiia bacterium]